MSWRVVYSVRHIHMLTKCQRLSFRVAKLPPPSGYRLALASEASSDVTCDWKIECCRLLRSSIPFPSPVEVLIVDPSSALFSLERA
jgi:hypothetical protein